MGSMDMQLFPSSLLPTPSSYPRVCLPSWTEKAWTSPWLAASPRLCNALSAQELLWPRDEALPGHSPCGLASLPGREGPGCLVDPVMQRGERKKRRQPAALQTDPVQLAGAAAPQASPARPHWGGEGQWGDKTG